MKSLFLLSCCFFFYISGTPTPPQNSVNKNAAPKIQPGGKSYVLVELKNVQDSVRIYSSYWPLLLQVNEHFTEDYTLAQDTGILLSFDISVPSGHLINIGEQKELSLFLVPSDTLELTVDFSENPSNGRISFAGRYAHINRYLYEKPRELATNMKGNHFFHNPYHSKTPEETLWKFKEFTDSIAQLQHNYLEQNRVNYKLPDWFIKYEQNEITLNAAYSQKMIIANWDFSFQLRMEPPKAYLQSIAEPEFHYPTSLYSSLFYPYVNLFVTEEGERKGIKIRKENRRFLNAREYKIQLSVADSLLQDQQLLKPYLTAHFFMNTREAGHKHGPQYMKHLKDLIQDPLYLNFIAQQHEALTSRLLKGDRAPDFLLLNHESGQYMTLPDFEGNLVLLNFWFPGCKPCIKEIPYEKKLLEQYGGKLTIANICFEATVEQWEKALEKYQPGGTNLVAQGNWERKLKEAYMIGGFPHYTLIDQNGNIIENNTHNPSNPKLAGLIEAHLE